MATFSSVTSQHLLAAIAEHDERGAEAFLASYGFEPSTDAQILHFGRRYDARAILAVAHLRATGRIATPDEFRSSLEQALTIARRRGFEVSGPTTVTRRAPSARGTRASGTAAPRKPATPRKPAETEKPPAICPTCSMALPATGVCDWCG
ncbi:MAG: hypothetical protein GX593_09575 [Actinomycetales bacterium]|nr:hypothetical protein [Actinomycetales bacterium]